VARLAWESEASETTKIIETGKKKGRRPTRDQLHRVRGAPDLDVGSMRILHCYDTLSTTRIQERIPWNAVKTFADHHCLTYEVTNHLWNVIRLVDQKVVERMYAEREARRKSP
jgi:hypothetical protein